MLSCSGVTSNVGADTGEAGGGLLVAGERGPRAGLDGAGGGDDLRIAARRLCAALSGRAKNGGLRRRLVDEVGVC